MCGIAGVRRFGPEPITEDQISSLLVANAKRGIHASGVALQQPDGETHVLKMPLPAWSFVTSDEYEAFIANHLREDTTIAIVHTRAATQGSPRDARNNHPIWNGTTAVVHNGMISNDHTLFREKKYERVGEVDSDILRAILDKHGLTKKGIHELQDVDGSVALAAISNKYPGKIILGRSGSPLELASTEHQLIWASEKYAIHQAMRPVKPRHGFPMQANRLDDLCFITMADASIYILGELKEKEENGIRFFSSIEYHDEFKTTNYYRRPNYDVHGTYFNQKRFDNQRQGVLDVLFCEKCEEYKVISESNRLKRPWELQCSKCKTPFMQAPPER